MPERYIYIYIFVCVIKKKKYMTPFKLLICVKNEKACVIFCFLFVSVSLATLSSHSLCQHFIFFFLILQFPVCDKSHLKHNELTGDNVGPLILKKKTI